MSRLERDHVHEFDTTVDTFVCAEDLPLIAPDDARRQNEPSRAQQIHDLSLKLHQPSDETSTEQSPRYSSEANNRQYARCPIPDERTNGVLSVNGRMVNCRLVEISIGGFGVVVARDHHLKPGTVGTLRAPGLHYNIRVSRQEKRDDGIFVGLKQLEEIVDHEEQQTSITGYVFAGVLGALIATVSYYFMYGA